MSLKESCGVFGACTPGRNVFPLLYWGMISQNHRGHQSHGFSTYNGKASMLETYTGLGLIPMNLETDFEMRIPFLKGELGVANVRYATSGQNGVESLMSDAMPTYIKQAGKSVTLSFNGNIVNISQLRNYLGIGDEKSDAYALTLLFLRTLIETEDVRESARECMDKIDGSFSIIGLTEDGTLFAFKDPYGMKPLCYGYSNGDYAFSSESVGLSINGIEYKAELNPGEIFTLTDGKLEKTQITKSNRKAFCSFEFAYFSRPDSKLNGKYVYQVRRDFGTRLAKTYYEKLSECEIVISLPETANDATYGVHEESGIPWEMATRRHRYVTQRAFISDGCERDEVIFRKMNILGDLISGKRIAVVDDSIVRGDTTRSIIKRLRKAGAMEIHVFITFPRIIGPCFYGINMATFSELIGNNHTPEEIAKDLGADSVNYLPISEYVAATGMKLKDLCSGCLTLEYPTPMANELSCKMSGRLSKGQLEVGRIYELGKTKLD
jgi:amidophosphoribosyltransferase